MFKKICIAVLVTFLCVGCSNKDANNEETIVDVSVLLPNGATSVSHVGLIADQVKLTNGKTIYDVVGADVITANMTSGSYDFVVAPTNLGIKLINNGADYKIAGVLTTGNLYVIALDPENIDKVVAFNQGAVPDKVMKAVFEANEYNPDIQYVEDVASAQALLLSGEANCILIAEPALTAIKAKLQEQGKEVTVVYDLQVEFEKISGSIGYPQASIFVKNGTEATVIEKYLTTLQESITTWKADSEALSATISDEVADLVGVKAAIIGKTYNRLGINYSNALDFKEQIDKFLTFFGMEATTEDIYYK